MKALPHSSKNVNRISGDGVKTSSMRSELAGIAIDSISDKSLRAFLGYRMKRAFNVVQSDLAETLRPFGLRMITFTTLVLIVDNPGARLSQLSDAVAIERPNLVAIVDELEKRGLVARRRMQSDRRAFALIPTESGQKLCAEALAAVQDHEERILREIEPALRRSAASVMASIEGLAKGNIR
jgi:DNA-binding MarR family transcriptional regulator